MKCHYTYDKIAGKILIPYCWPVVISGNMRDCTCRMPHTERQFEKIEYNKIITEKNNEIKDLEHENALLNRLLRKKYGI